MVICDYAASPRPRIPFPYYAEVMTGFEHSAAALMIFSGMIDEGIECIHNIRSRYDGEKRNPWDEAECGHHYARAMASWSSIVALSGFSYDRRNASVVAAPRLASPEFQCFWATGTAWGTFAYSRSATSGTQFVLSVLFGNLPCQSCEIKATGTVSSVQLEGKSLAHGSDREEDRLVVRLNAPLTIGAQQAFRIEVHS
jgi:non-lysosomal glucosylceramidase